MFVGWTRPSFGEDLEQFAQSVLCDQHLILATRQNFPDMTFVAYDEGVMCGIIGGCRVGDGIFINSLHYQTDCGDEARERLMGLMMGNFPNESMTVMAHEGEKELFEGCGFVVHSPFSQALYSGEKVVFNFTSAMSKRITSENPLPLLMAYDKRAFGVERSEYLHTLLKPSSLHLSTTVGVQHSYGLDKGLVKISPWVMEDGAFSDAEQLIRGVLYHRGLKKIFAIIPSHIEEITKLYRSYGFKLTDNMLLMYKGAKPKIDLEMVYGF